MHPARLVIVCGLPGAGKTARARQLAERFGAARMSPGDWMERLGVDVRDETARLRIERLQADLTADLLRLGTSVVVEWGTWMRAERDALRESALGSGALAHLEFLDAAIDVLWDRVRDRERRVSSRPITRADLEAWAELIERPTEQELGTYDPMPPMSAGERRATVSYPYGSWLPQSRPR